MLEKSAPEDDGREEGRLTSLPSRAEASLGAFQLLRVLGQMLILTVACQGVGGVTTCSWNERSKQMKYKLVRIAMIGHLDWFYKAFFVLGLAIFGLATYLWMEEYRRQHFPTRQGSSA
jgi:hypothetical protein